MGQTFDGITTNSGYYINKIIASPSGSDLTKEYFEFRGPAGAIIPTNLYFIAIEGDGESGSLTKVSEAIQLGDGTRTFGTNGMLAIVSNYTDINGASAYNLSPLDADDGNADVKTTNSYTAIIAAGTTIITIELEGRDITKTDSGAVISRSPDIGYDGNLSDPSATYMLITSDANPKNKKIDVLLNSDGVTAGNDGIIDATGDHIDDNWVLYDSVSYLDDDGHGGSGEYGYGQIIFAQLHAANTADIKTTTSATIIDHNTTSDINYLFRQGTKTGFTTNDWVGAANGSGSSVPNWVITGSSSKINRAYYKSFQFGSGNNIEYGALNPVEPNAWNGTTADWGTASNWDLGILPAVGGEVTIDGTGSAPIISSSTGVNIHKLTLTGETVTINSGGSLIVTGSSTGNVIYQVAANDTNWHLLSSPVNGATYNGTWISDNDIDDTTGTGTNIAIGTYTNTVDADGDWNYVTDATNSGSFTVGKGYSIKRDGTTNSYITFTGTIKVDNLTATINQNTNNWNLVGNPFPSYILVSDLISSNTSNLSGSHQTVYVWDNNKLGGAGYVALTGTDYIHPAQGFFVNAANSSSDNFTIDASKLTHQTGKILYKSSSNKPSIKLFFSDGSKIEYTEINYLEGKTKGLDPSFDIGTFTGTSTAFSIYSHLISNSNGVDFMRQSLPNTNFEDLIVPIGVNAVAGKEIKFTAEALDLPSNLKVFIEDKVTNTFTRIDEVNSEYKVTLNETLNGIGRFYLHTNSSALSISDSTIENISIYKLNSSFLRITGMQQGKVNVKLFNITGKQVLNSSFKTNGVKDILLPKLETGVYIIQLLSETCKLNKKIILE